MWGGSGSDGWVQGPQRLASGDLWVGTGGDRTDGAGHSYDGGEERMSEESGWWFEWKMFAR